MQLWEVLEVHPLCKWCVCVGGGCMCDTGFCDWCLCVDVCMTWYVCIRLWCV